MLNATRTALKADLRIDEGTRLRLYLDSRGFYSIGTGRNLYTKGISAWEENMMLDHDVDDATTALDARYPWWEMLPPVQQRVMANLAFNLGPDKLAGFVHFLAAMKAHDWSTAAGELVNSEWYGQVGQRGPRMVGRLLGDSTSPLPPVAA